MADILNLDKATDKAPLYDRPLTVEVWYPAALRSGEQETTTYQSAMPGTNPSRKSFDTAGKAARDAAPLTAQRFPLILVSHGYPGSRYLLTYLTENLASKGYIVAAIDHTDSVVGDVKPFPSTLLNRSADQLFTIESLLDNDTFVRNSIDSSKIAIVGYSMGGYGALISAGAGLNPASPLMKFVPGDYLKDWAAASEKYRAIDRSRIKAIVAIAPWGMQPPYQAWTPEALANIHMPALFIAGDRDDVADFAAGIKPAFDAATQSERYLLVYREARHNTGGNPPPNGVPLDYGMLQSYDEPVWRKDRITAINQHFITAFLDCYVKGDTSRRAFLDIPVEKSDDGKWKPKPGGRDDGAFSTGHDEAGDRFWPGFQRRWALGLEWIARKPAVAR